VHRALVARAPSFLASCGATSRENAMITCRSFAALLLLILWYCTRAIDAIAANQCVAKDLTGTPLNVRTTPNGHIVGTLNNGDQVTVLDGTSDRKGKSWVYVGDYKDNKPIGWVFREFIACYIRADRPSSPRDPPMENVAGTTNTPPLAGCYERIYDSAHLAAHKGQLVTRATLSISAASPEWQRIAPEWHFIAEADLKIWVRGRNQSFDSLGTCRAEGDGLLCNGSSSAAEADECKSKRDGIRQCRIMSAGSVFEVVGKPEGVLVTVREQLELVPYPGDSGPFLYFSPTNTENHAFLLKRAFGVCNVRMR